MRYFVRLSIVACLFTVLGMVRASAQNITPPDLPGLTLWLRADSLAQTQLGGDSVTKWKDVSGNGYSTMGPAAADSLPTLIAHVPLLNNHPAIKFNGTTNMFYGVEIPNINTSSLTVFILSENFGEVGVPYADGLFTIGTLMNGMWLYGRTAVGTNEDYTFLNNYSSTGTAVLSAGINTMPDAGYPFTIWGMQKIYGQSAALYINGSQSGPTNTTSLTSGTFTNAPYLIGNTYYANLSGFDNLHGAIAEIIIYNTPLAASDMQKVENYLYNKYAPAVNLGADIHQNYSLCADTLKAGNGYTSYLWSTGETTSEIVVSGTGTYWVSTVDVFNRSSMDTITVSFPSVNLQTLDSTVCAGSAVTVATELSSTSHYSFLWNTGATTSTISASTGGNYFVKVTDTTGCFSLSDTMLLVVDSLSDKITLGGDTNLCKGNSISLINPSNDWNTLNFQWSTGSTDSLATITTEGTYSVTVTDPIGCKGTASLSVNITKPGNAPVVNFSGDTVCFGSPFEPGNLTTPYNSISSWIWSFGDTGTSTSGSPTHNYAGPGYYFVSLSAVNNVGCSNSIRKVVEVHALPTASFTAGPGCTSNSIQFTDLSSAYQGDSISIWAWNFGDGTQSAASNPSHQYNSSGNFNVTLTVTNNVGCPGSVGKNISVGGSANLTGVTLVVPGNGAVFTSGDSIVFGWNSIQSASRYGLIISTDPYFDAPIVYGNLTVNQQIVSGLQTNTTYYWEILSYNICGDSMQSAIDSFSIFNPASFGCLTLWLRGDHVTQTGGNITTWNDSSGLGNSTTGPISTDSTPTVITQVPLINNKPSINFNGTTNEFYGPQIQGINNSSITTFILSKNNGEPTVQGTYTDGLFTVGSRDQGMWLYGNLTDASYTFINNFSSNDSSLAVPNSMPSSGYPYTIWGMRKNYGQEVGLYQNGTLKNTSTNPVVCGPFTNGPYMVGNTDWNQYPGFDNLHGEIAEIIVYTCALSDNEVQEVQNYLYTRYAPPVYLGPDFVQKYRLCPDTLKAGDRFVSYAWSTGDTTDQIAVSESGTYWVSVVDVFGRSSYDTIHITMPYLGTSPDSDTVVCIGASASIYQLLNNTGTYYFRWNAGGSNDSLVVNTPGTYSTTITDTTGCKIVASPVRVKLDSFSLVQLVAPDTLICGGSSVSLNDTAYQVVAYNWAPGNDTSAVFLIHTSGLYSVTVTDINGCSASGSVNVTTHGAAPSANFTVDNLCLGTSALFTNESQPVLPDAIDSFYWDFAGGSPSFSTLQNPTTNYHAFGNYSVTLHLTTDSGCTAAKTEVITVYPRPNASFNYEGSNNSQGDLAEVICAGTYVQFTDTSLAVGGSALTGRVWEFDGVVDTDDNAQILHEFTQEGDYEVTLSVTNTDGCVDSITLPVEVFAPFIADFTYSGTCGDDTTRFIDITHSFSVIGWQWAFGDGSTSMLQNPTHQYATPGSNTVTMTIENAIGCISTVSKNVNVYQNPIAGFAAKTGCVNNYYNPLNNSQAFNDPIVTWNWNIAGALFNVQSPQYYFADTGTYHVSLAVTTQNGCYDSTAQNIVIEQNPVALFAYNPVYGTAPVNVNFINFSAGAESYIWNFDDGTTSTDTDPVHLYTIDSTFNVVLIAENAYGCVDSATKTYVTKPTDLDIAVIGVSAFQTVQTDGSVLVQVIGQIANLGTRIITSAEIKAIMGSGGVLVQNWTGNLLSGQIIVDTFPSLFNVSAASANSYVCIQASNVNNGEIETNYNNNEFCSSLTGTMQLSGPYPNPAGTQSVLGIVLPQAGQVNITIFDELGRYVMNQQAFNMTVGYNSFQVPVQLMTGGEYFIRIQYNTDTEVREIIVR